MKRGDRKPAVTDPGVGKPLRDCVRAAMDKYFSDLDGERPDALYQLVLAEVEKPLLATSSSVSTRWWTVTSQVTPSPRPRPSRISARLSALDSRER